MSIIWSLIVGAIIGATAAAIMHVREGWVANIIVGIVGSFLGSYIFGNLLGLGGAANAGTFSVSGLLWGVVGAVILLAILRAFGVMGRRS